MGDNQRPHERSYVGSYMTSGNQPMANQILQQSAPQGVPYIHQESAHLSQMDNLKEPKIGKESSNFGDSYTTTTNSSQVSDEQLPLTQYHQQWPATSTDQSEVPTSHFDKTGTDNDSEHKNSFNENNSSFPNTLTKDASLQNDSKACDSNTLPNSTKLNGFSTDIVDSKPLKSHQQEESAASFNKETRLLRRRSSLIKQSQVLSSSEPSNISTGKNSSNEKKERKNMYPPEQIKLRQPNIPTNRTNEPIVSRKIFSRENNPKNKFDTGAVSNVTSPLPAIAGKESTEIGNHKHVAVEKHEAPTGKTKTGSITTTLTESTESETRPTTAQSECIHACMLL